MYKNFLVVNPKNTMNLTKLIFTLEACENIMKTHAVQIILTSPIVFLSELKTRRKKVLLAAQSLDENFDKPGMGNLTISYLKEIGVDMAIINHADNQLSLSNIIRINSLCLNNNIKTIVCSESYRETELISYLSPTIILVEEQVLIGSKKISELDYILKSIDIVKKINSKILVEYGAGVRTGKDVFKIISNGVDGVGATSAFTKSQDIKSTLLDFVNNILGGAQEYDKNSE